MYKYKRQHTIDAIHAAAILELKQGSSDWGI